MRFATPPPQVTEQGSNSLHSDHVAQGGFPQSTISKGGPRQPVPPTQRRVRNYTEMLVKKKRSRLQFVGSQRYYLFKET